jgi:hypothetical protein
MVSDGATCLVSKEQTEALFRIPTDSPILKR